MEKYKTYKRIYPGEDKEDERK